MGARRFTAQLKRAAALLILLLLLMGPVGVSALTVPAPTDCFYVNDFADILSQETEEHAVSVNVTLYQKCGAQVVLTTVNSLEGASLEEYATEMFRTYGIGSKEKNNGVLLLVAVEDRACRMEVGYGLEGAINDAKSGRIQDEYIIPYFRENKWDEGMRNGFDAIVSEIANEYGIDMEGLVPATAATPATPATNDVPWYQNLSTVWLIAVGVAFVIGLLMGVAIHRFGLGILLCLLAPVAGHLILKACLPTTGFGSLLLSDVGMLLSYFTGWCITTKTVDGSSGGSSGSSRSSGYSSSGSSSHGSGYSGGGGRSGGGGSSRRF